MSVPGRAQAGPLRAQAAPGWPSSQDLASAQRLVAATLPPTPLVRLWGFACEVPVFLKLETVQPTGSFKVRGALAAVAAYAASGRAIVTASAGNHGLGVAWAATRLGVTATVVVPTTASQSKIDALRSFAVTLVLEGDRYEDAERHAISLAGAGAQFVSAYNDPQVMAGQSTLLAEVLDQLEGAFTIVTPVGGGGLVAGIALAAAEADRSVRVVGVESARSLAVSSAVAAGHVVPVEVETTLADGLAGNLEAGAVTPAVLRSAGTAITSVDEAELRHGLRYLATHAGLYVEGSAAVGVAALLEGRIPADQPIVLAITGRNITPAAFAEVLG